MRKLLIKGANQTMRNKEGKLALDIAIENDYDNIASLLVTKSS